MKKLIITVLIPLSIISSVAQNVWYVDDVGANGTGTFSNPFNNIEGALNAAASGDTVLVMPGVFALSGDITVPKNNLRLKAYNSANRPVVSSTYDRVVDISGVSGFILDGFAIDGLKGTRDIIQGRNAPNTTIRNCEIKNSARDGIDIDKSDGLLIENCEIHHLLNGDYTIAGQADCHGIVTTATKNVTIRGCNIYYFSGDAFQTDPNRIAPFWDNILIENCKMWTGPLPADFNLWKAGEVPGENAIDFKVDPAVVGAGYRAKVVLKNIEAYGYIAQPAYMGNRAAFNIKEHVEVTVENCIIHNSEIAFRLRGPGTNGGAKVTIINSIAYDNDKAFRIEDNIDDLHIYNSTFGQNTQLWTEAGGGYDTGFEMFNCLFMGTKPLAASHSSNLSANASFFVNEPNNDYHLASGSSAINAGINVAVVTKDYDGNIRPGGSCDVGAFEYQLATVLEDMHNQNTAELAVYPNPFCSETNLSYNLMESKDVLLEIYDVYGQIVTRLVNENQPTGNYKYMFSLSDKKYSAGLYLIRFQADKGIVTKRLACVY